VVRRPHVIRPANPLPAPAPRGAVNLQIPTMSQSMRKIFLALVVTTTGGLLWGGDAASAAPTPRMLVEISDLSDVAISPDGAVAAFRREAASVERNTYDTAWFVAPIDGAGAPRRVADGGAPLRYIWGPPIIEPPVWSADSQWIYYRAFLGGEVQVWRAARDGSRAEPVTQDAADVESFVLGSGGRSLVYTVGATREAIRHAEDDEDDSGIRIDDRIFVGQNLIHSGFVNGRLATQRLTNDGRLEAGLLDDQPKRQRAVDLTTLKTRDATDAERANLGPVQDPDADEDTESITRAPSGAWAAYLTPLVDGLNVHKWKVLRAVAEGNRSVTSCEAAACQKADIAAFAWRPAHHELVFTVTDHERGRAQSLYGWDIASNTVRSIVHADGLLNGGRLESGETPCSIGERFAVCVGAAANTPPRLERIDLQTGARQVLYDPNPTLHDGSERPVSLVTWTDGNGHRFTGQFFPPTVTGPGRPAPLFIAYYTCPGYVRGSTPGDEWPLATMAADGIAALCINQPFVVPFEATDRYDAALSGVRSIVDILAKQHAIDRTRVGMGGLSFGSEVTMWAAMNSNLLAAASVASPFASQTYYWFMALRGDKELNLLKKAWGLGAPSETPDRWKQLSPSYNLDKIHTPILMQLPEQEYLETVDYLVPLLQSSTPVEMFAYPNEAHQKTSPRHKLAVYERNLDWFRFWLQDYVDPDPQKAAQYGRWKAEKQRAGEAGPLAVPRAPSDSPGGQR
jgi:dipeptidyl aminopeptidase/acylaminoacyl peptidase